MATDAQRVMARGIEVKLADGETYRLKFDLEAIEHLEEQWDGLAAFIESFNAAITDGLRARRVKVIRTAVEAGLLHTGLRPEESRRLVTAALLIPPSALMLGIRDALNEALREPEEGSEGNDYAEESDLSGAGSTTSAPSDLAALILSGAA